MENSKPFKPTKLTLITLMLSSMVILMGAAVVAPALGQIGEHFGLDQSDILLAFVISLPALSVAITGFAVGYLADRFGRAKVLFTSLAIFTVFGVLPFLGGVIPALDNYGFVLVCRFILGIGITGISSCTTALIGGYWTGKERGKVIGYQSAAIGVGTLILETLGGSLGGLEWNMPFLVYLIGAVIIVCGIFSIREPKVQKEVADMPEPEIPNKNGKIAFCYFAVFAEMFLMFALPMNLATYCASEIDMNSTVCGLLLGLMGIAQAVFSMIYSRNASKLDEKTAYAFAFLLMGIGLVLLYFPHIITCVASMILVGTSLGLLMPTVIGSLTKLSTAKTSGKVMGGYAVALNLGTFLSGLLVTVLYNAVGQKYTLTFAVLAVVSVVIFAVCIVFRLSKKGEKDTVSSETVHTEVIAPSVSMSDEVKMYDSILVPTDGSENSNYAIENAVNIAKKNGSALTALYVVDSDRFSGLTGDIASAESIKAASKEMSDQALSYASKIASENGIAVTTKVILGRPAETIIDESKGYDLVVCGSLGRTNIARALMGSVAEKVVRMAYCPVLVCRKNKA